jgi:hypothetical protein
MQIESEIPETKFGRPRIGGELVPRPQLLD